MNVLKLSSIAALVVLSFVLFTPEASAKHCRSRSAFGFNVNIGGPSYVVAPAPVVVAAPQPVYAVPGQPVYAVPQPVYATYPPTYYYNAPVVVERPAAYVQPGFSYSYFRR